MRHSLRTKLERLRSWPSRVAGVLADHQEELFDGALATDDDQWKVICGRRFFRDNPFLRDCFAVGIGALGYWMFQRS